MALVHCVQLFDIRVNRQRPYLLAGESHSCVFFLYNTDRQACNDFMSAAQVHQQTVTEELNAEREKRQRLEDTVEAIAKQHNALERAVIKQKDLHRSSVGGAISPSDESSNGGSHSGRLSSEPVDDSGSAKSGAMSDYDDDVSVQCHQFCTIVPLSLTLVLCI